MVEVIFIVVGETKLQTDRKWVEAVLDVSHRLSQQRGQTVHPVQAGERRLLTLD